MSVPDLARLNDTTDYGDEARTGRAGNLSGMSECVLLVPRDGPAIRAALAQIAPDELAEFEGEFRIALAEADEDFDLARVYRVLDRWVGCVHLRLNPPTAAEEALVAQVERGDFDGLASSPIR